MFLLQSHLRKHRRQIVESVIKVFGSRLKIKLYTVMADKI